MKLIGNGGHAAVVKSFYRGDDPIVAIGDNRTRRKVVNDLVSSGWWTNGAAVHPSAIIAEQVPIGVGTVIMAGVIVQAGAKIGQHVILNTGCTVDHHCVIGDYAHIAPGAHLCGGVEVGEGALIGVGVGIEPNVKIPAWSVVKREKYIVESVSDHAGS